MARWTEAPLERQADPFTAPPSARTGLVSGWLVDPPQAERRAAVSATRPAAWRALGAGWRRLERRAAARLGAVAYPLAGSRLLLGMGSAEARRLTRRFHADTPVELWSSPQAALLHLAALLPSWPVEDWGDVRGLHAFLGPAGSGKTTLLFRLARQLRGRGRNVTAVTLCTAAAPRAAFAALAAECGIPALLAASAPELERIVARCGASVLLVDTPCSAGETRALQPFLSESLLRHPRTVLHVCLSLQHGRASLEGTLRFGAAQRADCVAVSHVDLAAGGGTLLGLLLATPQRLSVAGGDANPAAPPLPMGAASLLAALRRGD